MKTKLFETFDTTLDEGSRTVVSVISTDALDRDGEVMLPSGLEKKNYAGNPVVLFNHDLGRLPVGKCLWVKSQGNKIIAKTYITDKTELGRDIFGLLQDDILKGVSIGFISRDFSAPTAAEIKGRPELAKARGIHRKWELFEYSFVTVPCNPEALTLAVSKGYSSATLKFLNGGELPTLADLETPDVWQWATPEPEPSYIYADDEPEPLPMPKYSRNISDVVKRLERFRANISGENLLDIYRGKV